MAQLPPEHAGKRKPPGRPPFQSGGGKQPEEFSVGIASYPIAALRFAAYEPDPDGQEDEADEDDFTQTDPRHAEPDPVP